MNNGTAMDPYKVLGISHGASDEEIKRAYKKAALQYHPDRRNKGSASQETESKMALINEAYSILKDKDRKNRYDYLYKYGRVVNDTNDDDDDYISRPPSTNATHKDEHSYCTSFGRGEQELRFQVKPGMNPFAFIPIPPRPRNRTESSFTFTFSSMTSQTAKDGTSKIYVRKYTQYQNGWKETHTETATVDSYGNTVYKRSMTREKGQLQNLKDMFTSLLGMPPQASNKSSHASCSCDSADTATSKNHDTNNSHHPDWLHGFINQVRKCTGSCGGSLFSLDTK